MCRQAWTPAHRPRLGPPAPAVRSTSNGVLTCTCPDATTYSFYQGMEINAAEGELGAVSALQPREAPLRWSLAASSRPPAWQLHAPCPAPAARATRSTPLCARSQAHRHPERQPRLRLPELHRCHGPGHQRLRIHRPRQHLHAGLQGHLPLCERCCLPGGRGGAGCREPRCARPLTAWEAAEPRWEGLGTH